MQYLLQYCGAITVAKLPPAGEEIACAKRHRFLKFFNK